MEEVVVPYLIPEDAIFEIVRDAIVLALAVEPDEVEPEKKLISELGAESIDFLDITFRLEQCLPIKIPRDDLIEQAEEIFGEEAAVDRGRLLTPLGVYLIQNRLGGIDLSQVKVGMTVEEISDLWTVQSWVVLAQRLLDTITDQFDVAELIVRCEDDIYEVLHRETKTIATSVPGDELNQRWFEEIAETDAIKQLIALSIESSEPVAAGASATLQ
jgi:acyl carrier protein